MAVTNPQELLAILDEQEKIVQFDEFNNDIAFTVGLRIFEICKYRNTPVSIEITVNGWRVFKYAMSGGPRPDNDGWLYRKANVVNQFHRSSLAVKTMMEIKGDTLETRCLDSKDYFFCGGGFPIIVKNIGVIGSICVSALHHTEDHQIIVDACARYLGVQAPSIF